MKTINLLAGACLLFTAFASTPAFADSYAFIPTDISLRAGPAKNYPVVKTLPSENIVIVNACLRDYSWCDITTMSKKRRPAAHGWVQAKYMQYAYRRNSQFYIRPRQNLDAPIARFELIPYWDAYYRDQPFYRDRNNYLPRDHEYERKYNQGRNHGRDHDDDDYDHRDDNDNDHYGRTHDGNRWDNKDRWND